MNTNKILQKIHSEEHFHFSYEYEYWKFTMFLKVAIALCGLVKVDNL